MKTIVVFYSHEGSTRRAAEYIADGLRADIGEIRVKKPIPYSGPGKFLIGGCQALLERRVPIEKLDFDPQEYDSIILGTPVWAGRCAPAINTFLKEYKVADKVDRIFTLSGSGNDEAALLHLTGRLTGMRHHMALFDYNTDQAIENASRIVEFIREEE